MEIALCKGSSSNSEDERPIVIQPQNIASPSSDTEQPPKMTTNGQQQNAITTPKLNGLPFPMLLVERVTSCLGDYPSFADRIRVAAVCRQLSEGVIRNMRQMRERFMDVQIHNDHILVNQIKVKNDLSPPKDQMECVLALMAFGQPTLLDLMTTYETRPRLIDVHRILSSVSSLSVTRLQLRLHIEQFGGEAPFNDIMEVIGGMTNLETLHLGCRCEETPASLAHRNSLPSVPDDSPFNHLLKLERLRGLIIAAPELVSPNPKQQADLLNRSLSTIRHLCWFVPIVADTERMFESMNAVVRANITSACFWDVYRPMCLLLVTNLPNCQSICCRHVSDHPPLPTREKIDEMADELLTLCHDNDDRRGKTLQLQIALWPNKLQEYLANGGRAEVKHNREQTVVSVTLAEHLSYVRDADCCLGIGSNEQHIL